MKLNRKLGVILIFSFIILVFYHLIHRNNTENSGELIPSDRKPHDLDKEASIIGYSNETKYNEYKSELSNVEEVDDEIEEADEIDDNTIENFSVLSQAYGNAARLL